MSRWVRLLLTPAAAGPWAGDEPAPAEERKERDTLKSFSSSPMRHISRKELPGEAKKEDLDEIDEREMITE